jgi:hypothetical protein
MERLISKSVAARIPLPGGGSPSRRLAVAGLGGGGGVEPWAGRLRAQPRLGPIAARPHDGVSAPPREAAPAAAVGPPWKLLWSLLPKVTAPILGFLFFHLLELQCLARK